VTGANGNGSGADAPPIAPREPDSSPAVALVPYLRALRVHLLLIVSITVITTAAAAAWLLQKEPQYEAEAKILVSPLPDDDPSFVGLPLVRAVGSDSTRPTQTAATLIRTPVATTRTARRLGIPVAAVEEAVVIEPAEDSNLLDVRATAADPDEAAELANTYADAALDARRSELAPIIRARKLQLRRELAAVPDQASPTADLLRVRLSGLKSIENGKDPTLSITREADVPETATSAEPRVVVAAAAVGGLLLGLAVALLLEILAPRRINAESDLLPIYPLPILARIPLVPTRGRTERALDAGRQRFRGLRLQLMVERARAGEFGAGSEAAAGAVVVVTSGTPGDGRTSTVLSLARACASARQSAIVVDLDLRKPELAARLGIEGEDGLEAVRRGELAATPGIAPVGSTSGLGAVVGPAVSDPAELEAILMAIPGMLDRLRWRADWVIVDTPPLPDATIGLPALAEADHSLVVVRPGNTREEDLVEVRELAETRAVVPDGYVLIGARAPAARRGTFARRRRRRRAESAVG
jgi:receptor protein-tyrosine kinase/non-specific protein-tyrosine kinase